MKKQSGVTLIELVIVVVIVAILASIAIPSYREYVRKGNRRAAQAVMMDIANRERQYFMANRTFADADTLDYTLPTDVDEHYDFTIDVSDGPPPTFSIDFDSQGGQAADGDLSLDSDGTKGPEGKW